MHTGLMGLDLVLPAGVGIWHAEPLVDGDPNHNNNLITVIVVVVK
ncbi:MAG: hypothetical protein ACE5H7_17065 [Acidiferrobacterales bacterium]